MKPPRTVPPPTAYGTLADEIRSQIIAGELTPGHRLPSESELSQHYNVGRGTAREAIRMLASQGFVTITRGASGGTFVSHPTPEQMSSSLQMGLSLLTSSSRMSVSELMEVREILEVPAVKLAAERRTQGELEWIRSSLFDRTDVAPQVIYQHSQHFHTRVLSAAHNQLMMVVAQPVFGVLDNGFLSALSPSVFWRHIEQEHREIFDCIEAGDAEGAGEAARTHLQYLRQAYERVDRKSSPTSHDR
jgi:DNA-binding FadR family transcriptional regulator